MAGQCDDDAAAPDEGDRRLPGSGPAPACLPGFGDPGGPRSGAGRLATGPQALALRGARRRGGRVLPRPQGLLDAVAGGRACAAGPQRGGREVRLAHRAVRGRDAGRHRGPHPAVGGRARRGAVDGSRTPRRCGRDAGPAPVGPSGRRARRPGRGGSGRRPDGRRRGRQRAPHHHGGHAPGLVRRRRPAPAPGPGGAGLPRPVRPAAVRRGLAGPGRPGLRHRGWFGAREPAQSGRAGTGRPGRHQRRLLLPLRAAARRRRRRRRRAERTGGVGGDHHRRAGPTWAAPLRTGDRSCGRAGALHLGRRPGPLLRRRRLGVDGGAPARAAPSDRCRRLRRLHFDSAVDGAARLAVPACVLAASRPAG